MRIGPCVFAEKPVPCVYWRPVLNEESLLISSYRVVPYLTKSFMGILAKEEVREAEKLVNQFLAISGLPSCAGIYLRCDCYLGSDGHLLMLEINSLSTDGWGPAWHLSRIAGSPVDFSKAFFPKFWTTYDPRFMPALRLAVQELVRVGRVAEIISWQDALQSEELVYAYLQNASCEYPANFVPRCRWLENKLRFARFSQYWEGRCVKIPKFYWYETDPLFKLAMGKIVIKRCEKSSASNKDSVIFTSEKNVPTDLIDALLYLRGDVLAQELVETVKIHEDPVQVILLFAPSHDFRKLHFAGGYLQIAPCGTKIINDAAAHSPLILQGAPLSQQEYPL